MRKSTYAILTGTLAFGLTAAAATGTAFTINSVQNAPGTDTATANVTNSSCGGTYDIDWTFNSSGQVTAFTATRTAPTPTDDSLQFCASMPFAFQVLPSGGPGETVLGTTDAEGDATGTFVSPWILGTGSTVSLEIGPDASF